MKFIYTIALTLFAAATFSSCNSTAYTNTYDYPDPEYARTSNELQEVHGKLIRQHY